MTPNAVIMGKKTGKVIVRRELNDIINRLYKRGDKQDWSSYPQAYLGK